jgi:hypothetical protein
MITLIEKKYFNTETPENYNVYTSNFNGISHYYNGINWIVTKNKELIQELHNQNLEEVIDMFNELNRGRFKTARFIPLTFLNDTHTECVI